MNVKIKIGDYDFEGPYDLFIWSPTSQPGIYAIYVHLPKSTFDPNEGPIFIGETDNFANREIPYTHKKRTCWEKIAGDDGELFIAYYPMDGSTFSERKDLESHLIDQFKPVCNEKI